MSSSGAVGATAGPDAAQGPQLSIKAAPHVDETPTEVVRAQFSIDMACALHFVDFEGLVDGRSAKNIIRNMQPRRALTLHGGALSFRIRSDASPPFLRSSQC